MGVGLVVLGAGLLVSRALPESYDATIMLTLAKSIVGGHGLVIPRAVDPFRLNTPHASYGIGMTLLMLPAAWLGPHLGLSVDSLAMLVNPLLLPAIGLSIYAWARETGVSEHLAGAVALLTVLATPLLPYAATGFAENGVALGVAVALWAFETSSRRPLSGTAIAGAATGFAVLMRPDSLLLVAPIVGIAAVVRSRRTGVIGFVVGIAPALAFTAVYNVVRFGSPLVDQYQGVSLRRGFNHPWLKGLLGFTLSPGRALIFYAPLVVAAAAGIPFLWRRSRLLCSMCLALLAARVLFFSGWWAWEGGTAWGPRLLVPAMPVLAPGLLEVVRLLPSASRVLRAGFAALVTVSLGVQVLGAAVGHVDNLALAATAKTRPIVDPNNFAATATSPAAERATDSAMFDWELFPITDHARRLVSGDVVGRLFSPKIRPLPVGGLVALVCGGLALVALG